MIVIIVGNYSFVIIEKIKLKCENRKGLKIYCGYLLLNGIVRQSFVDDCCYVLVFVVVFILINYLINY